MEVSIIGKALTPVPLHYVPDVLSENGTEGNMRHLYIPLTRHYNHPKAPMQILLENKHKHQDRRNHAGENYERKRLNLTPSFRNMSLSETYNFAREQLKVYPMQQYQRRNLRTPTFKFTKQRLAGTEMNEQQEIQPPGSPETPLVSCRSDSDDVVPVKSSHGNSYTTASRRLARRQTKSVSGYHPHRRKSGRKKKLSPNTASSGDAAKLGSDEKNVPSDFSLRRNLLPPKTLQSPIILIKNNGDKPSKDDGVFITPQTRPLVKGYSSKHMDHSFKLPNTSRISKSLEYGSQDPLLSSLDSSLGRRAKHERQLSMRIQLIHKYGNEDVLGRHMEMRRKREAIDRHQKKNLEIQANARTKEIQRSKIYALNALMTKLEQEQFEEYKQSL